MLYSPTDAAPQFLLKLTPLVFAKFDPLKPASKEADNSVDIAVRDIKLFQLRY